MDNEKLVEWLKRLYSVKERVIFGLVALVLAFRVYQIMTGQIGTPPADEEPVGPRMPIPNIELPQRQPQPPVPPLEPYKVLYTQPHMFEERRPDEGTGPGDESGETADFQLNSIQKTAQGPMAIIYNKKGGRKSFVRKGQSFESDFTVTDINVEKKTVTVFNSATKKTFTLSVEE